MTMTQTSKKASASFLKKEAKNFYFMAFRLSMQPSRLPARLHGQNRKVFCFFFSKKKRLLPCLYGSVSAAAGISKDLFFGHAEGVLLARQKKQKTGSSLFGVGG